MVEKIPFAKPYFGLFSDRLKLKETLSREVDEAAVGGRISNGEKVRKLEERVAKISGAEYAFACSSASQGLNIMLSSCGAKGLCLQQSFTWDTTLIAAIDNGNQTMPFDIDYETWSVKHFPMLPTPGYALAVDTFGLDVCPTSDVPIFYDRAHSLGVKFKNLGVASVLSMSPSKIVTASEGGIILTDKKNFAESIEHKRDLMSRMSEFLAIIGLHTLDYLGDILVWKDECFEAYRKSLPFQFQSAMQNSNHQVIGMLLDSHEQQQRLLTKLKDEIEFKAYYEPTHLKYKYGKPLPVTEDIARRIICLPSWYNAPKEEIIRHIKETLSI